MAVFVLSLILISNFLVDQLTFFKRHSRIQESNIEGIIGLELLRTDVQSAGYGLLWSYPGGATNFNCAACGEASNSPASKYNDFPGNVPRAILSGNDGKNPDGTASGTLNNSDYLVIKGINVSASATASRWTILQAPPFVTTAPGNPRIWTTIDDTPQITDRVVVLSFAGSDVARQLVAPSATTTGFFVQYGATNGSGVAYANSPWAPTDVSGLNIVYGVDSQDLTIPFNRADYYVKSGSATPSTCALGTGVLYKAVLRQSDGNVGSPDELPLLDCVADMQVVYGIDNLSSQGGKLQCYTDDLLSSTSGLGSLDTANPMAQRIRERLKEVRVYILAQEGQFDRSFKYSASSILVGDLAANLKGAVQTTSCSGTTSVGRNFDLTAIPNWQNYRWKIYTFTVTPMNLRGDK